jgi:Ca2+-binding RTX toxin-like protein
MQTAFDATITVGQTGDELCLRLTSVPRVKVVMHETVIQRLIAGASLLLFLVNACADVREPDYFDGVALHAMPLLASGCTIATNVMTVKVADGESVLVTLRASDSTVTVNGHIFNGTTDTGTYCEIAPTGTINIVVDAPGAPHLKGRAVILDYINGLFMIGAAAMPGIKVDFTLAGDTGALNWIKVRGSDGADMFSIGAGTGTGAAAAYALNVNTKFGTAPTQAGGTGGATVNLDLGADVTFKVASNVMINAGAGDDRLDANGFSGVGAAFPNPIKLFGGDGDDTMLGGTGADTLSGGPGADTLSGCQGADVYDMGSVASGADVIALACTTAILEGSDTVDYSKRTGAVTVNLSKTLVATNAGTDNVFSGEASGDGAHISDRVATLKLGAGDDTITIPGTSTVVHKVTGGAGDDTFTGGAVADTFDGETGDDSCAGNFSIMDYRARTNPVTVTVCTTGCSSADANDGDPSVSGSTHTGSGAATSATGGISLALLTGGSGFTPQSVGNPITFSSCASGTTNHAAWNIVEYIDANSIKIDASPPASFVADTCAFSEQRPNATLNTGTGAVLAARVATGSVTGLNHTANMLGHLLTLTHTAATSGGATHDDGTYPVVKVISASVVAIDNTAVVGFLGGVNALSWTEAGSERDDVRCATVFGGSGNDTLTGDGTANTLRGGPGNDTLIGGSGNDALFGEAGGDDLYGGPGSDTLTGGGGTGTDAADHLFGGDDNDILEGDTGADTFTCDGKNTPTASAGASPGPSDTPLDYTPAQGDTLATPDDCDP